MAHSATHELAVAFPVASEAVSLPYKSLTAVNGQFILCDKRAYNAIGGHKAVFDRVVEDMEIARKLKVGGYRIMTALGHDAITCRMYSGFTTPLKAFQKISIWALMFLRLPFCVFLPH